jgi:hypothetical protein
MQLIFFLNYVAKIKMFSCGASENREKSIRKFENEVIKFWSQTIYKLRLADTKHDPGLLDM